MPDIQDKLFPNLLTLIAQLLATGVIYFMYRKYVHNKVMGYLNKRAQQMEEANQEVQQLKLEKESLDITISETRAQIVQENEALKERLVKETNVIIKELQDASKEKIRNDEKQFEIRLVGDKEKMLKEVEAETLDLAKDMSIKILESINVPDNYYVDLLTKLDTIDEAS